MKILKQNWRREDLFCAGIFITLIIQSSGADTQTHIQWRNQTNFDARA